MSVWKSLREEIIPLLLFFGAYLLFHRLANFTAIQSWMLAALTWLVLRSLELVGQKERPHKFEPFSVSVVPSWYEILTDQRLLSEGGWEQLNSAPRIPGYRVMHEGLKITRLTPHLSYSNNYHAFLTDISISEELTEVPPPPLEGKDAILWSPPRFYVRQVLDKYPKHGNLRCLEFGLVTTESLERSIDRRDHRFDIVLARLPDAVFNPYYADENFVLNKNVDSDEENYLFRADDDQIIAEGRCRKHCRVDDRHASRGMIDTRATSFRFLVFGGRC